MKILAFVILISAALFIPAAKTDAHVFVIDSELSEGAVLHINPDDDPVAGETSYFYLDTEALASGGGVTLEITNSEGLKTEVLVETSGTLATAEFVFPAQGVYELVFRVETESRVYYFEHTQRVSRGLTDSLLDEQNHVWAEASLLASGLGLAVVLIVAYNRRVDIGRQSSFK